VANKSSVDFSGEMPHYQLRLNH